jgi:protein-disulfide isomerase
MHLIQRLFLVLMLATSPLAVASVASAAELPPVTANDRVLGRADAPVMVVEYASFTCSHCADWHKDVFPAFKARYIDTGKVRLVFRNLPTAPANLAMSAAGIARCSAPDRFFAVVDSLFAGQPALATGSRSWFSDAIAAGGRTEDQIKACFADPATQAAITADIEGATAAGVNSTPTFFVNGRKVADPTLVALGAAIDAARTGT